MTETPKKTGTIQKVLRFPWGRLACVIGAVWSGLGIESGPEAPLAFAIFMASAVALHGLAIWRDKP